MDILLPNGIAAVGLVVSLFKDRGTTKMALKKAWKAFEVILGASVPGGRCPPE